jgi:hypothetical protein
MIDHIAVSRALGNFCLVVDAEMFRVSDGVMAVKGHRNLRALKSRSTQRFPVSTVPVLKRDSR